jgi:glyoxylase-like metal-dependent hydrolase (beta-lactamase superfamily II)
MKQALLAFFSAIALLSCATQPREPGLVNRAVEAMGGADRLGGIRTATVKANVKYWEPEQSDVPGGDPRFAAEASYDQITDIASRSSRIDWVTNFAYPAPRTFTYSEIRTPQGGYILGVDSNGRNAESLKSNPPQHSMSGYRLAAAQRESRRGAIGNLVLAMHRDLDKLRPAADMVVQGRSYPAVAFQEFIVAFDPQTGLPARVRTLDYDNVWGDVTYDLVYSDWRDTGGIRIPMNRKYELNGRVVMDITYSDIRFNQPIDTSRLQVPEALRANAAKPATGNVPYQWVIRRQFIGVYMDSDNVSYDTKGSPGLRLQELAPGVHHQQGGTHNSLVVEMSDHLVVVDAPVTDAQSLWLVKETRAKFPGKPIRWVVLTHHHMDHAGGLRGLLADGGTLVVGEGAGRHFRAVLNAPITRNPDMPPREFHSTPILEVPESHVMSDSRGRQVIAYVMDNPHAKGMLMAYVPDAKLGFVTDIWTPGPPLPAKPNPGLAAVVSTVKRAGLQPERFAGGHGSSADYQMLARLVGQ